MKVATRKTSKYLFVEFSEGNTKIEMGLLDATERGELRAQMTHVIEAIDEMDGERK